MRHLRHLRDLVSLAARVALAVWRDVDGWRPTPADAGKEHR